MTQRADDQNVVRARRGSPGAQLTLTHYAAGGQQRRHIHGHTQISFLIAGSIRETIGRRCHEVQTNGACVKLAGVDHENLWGRTGALMLTARLRDADADDLARTPLATWASGPSPDRRVIRAALDAATAADVDAVILDLIGALAGGAPVSGGPPPWLCRVKDALWDGALLSADDAARLAGVHRVHFSRAFARHAGMPFSAYRRHVMLSRAVEGVLRAGAGLASVAHDSGFADQSHMNRTFASAFGTSPRRFRAALPAA